MIDPNNINTVRVGQLPSADFNLTDNLPHEVGTDLKQGTVQQLADVIGAYIGATASIAFRPVTVLDGETLPATTTEEWILVGAGTFTNVGGGANITTTEELNALVSNGTYWFIGVEIPINVELGITQFIRSGFLNTSPSEDAVFNALALKMDTSSLNIFTVTDKVTLVDNEQTITLPAGHKPLSVHLEYAPQFKVTSNNAGRVDTWTQSGDIITLNYPTVSGSYIYVVSQ
jgi:hypothetical protein